jgi:hypothetical protein
MELVLAGDEASYVSGQAIPVDGGLTASMPYTGKPILLGLAFGEPDDMLQRGIQYAAASRFSPRRLWNTCMGGSQE